MEEKEGAGEEGWKVMEDSPYTMTELKKVLSTIKEWPSAGEDAMPYFIYKIVPDALLVHIIVHSSNSLQCSFFTSPISPHSSPHFNRSVPLPPLTLTLDPPLPPSPLPSPFLSLSLSSPITFHSTSLAHLRSEGLNPLWVGLMKPWDSS